MPPISSIALCLLLIVITRAPALAAESGPEPAVSNVEGKKLIRVSQTLTYHTRAVDVPALVGVWQETGYDGLCFSLSIDADGPMAFRWWDVERRQRAEFGRDIDALKSVDDWGRLTDNFLWMASHAEGSAPPDWFNDEHWDIVLANARLGAGIAKELGFAGIVFDMEGYGGGAYGVWRQPWDYPLYAKSDYQITGEAAPRPFAAVAAKVRQRGREWVEALTSEYPGIVIFTIAGLYEVAWARSLQFGKPLEETDSGLWAAFVDGVLSGLGDEATLVSGAESTYLDSQYKDMLVHRDACLEQSLAVSAVPDLARERITFSAGIWTDAGYEATGRFSPTDARANQRNPERHRHAVHNALAASDRYAWQWGEWGADGESNFLTSDPTPVMREYWQANIDGHRPHDLGWEPEPFADLTDYSSADAEAQERDSDFWAARQAEGYRVVGELPELWKFRFDPEMKVRYSNWTRPSCDDAAWFAIESTSCWQSQGTRANG
ncbi:MAG TPA: hypothetical protein QGH10_09675, partial [Armatimonadota bacterium]|nr:hypothetical protein [Armatimonadota bacterium]